MVIKKQSQWIMNIHIPGEMSFIVSAKTSTSNQFKILKKFRNDCVSLYTFSNCSSESKRLISENIKCSSD
jgi:hypothetical protein